jgi:predicted MPP superfamily phosphohydrolase
MSSSIAFLIGKLCMILLLAAFHGYVARQIMYRVPYDSLAVRRGIAVLLALLIVLLDLPLAHILLLYKFYNPLVLDQLMHEWAAPWIALHLYTLILGAVLVGIRHIIRPLRKRFRFRDKRTNTMNLPTWKRGRTTTPSPESPSILHSSLIPDIEQSIVSDRPAVPTRRRFLRTAALAATGYVASSATLSAMRATDDYRLERAVIRIPGLPDELKGTTIAMVSDIHSSVFMSREEMENYVKLVNALKADMIFVPGDFVNSKLREIYPFCEAFTGLSAPFGVYGVTGNHDYYSGDIETIAREVNDCGIRLLRNENLSIEKGGKKLWLMGVDDSDIYDVKNYLQTGKGVRRVVENITHGIGEDEKKILLCHKPYPFEEYSRIGIDLMVSGHTHGGQVVIAQLDNINLSFAAMASKYVAGLYKARSNPNAQMYVTRGIGTVGIPLRLNCPPEITHITLV